MVRSVESNVEHMHYLYSNPGRERAVGEEGEVEDVADRLSQYVPCESSEDLRVLERKLVTDVKFNKRSVSFVKSNRFLVIVFVFFLLKVSYLVIDGFDQGSKRGKLATFIRKILKRVISSDLLSRTSWSGMLKKRKGKEDGLDGIDMVSLRKFPAIVTLLKG